MCVHAGGASNMDHVSPAIVLQIHILTSLFHTIIIHQSVGSFCIQVVVYQSMENDNGIGVCANSFSTK